MVSQGFPMLFQASSAGNSTTLARILQLVEAASSQDQFLVDQRLSMVKLWEIGNLPSVNLT